MGQRGLLEPGNVDLGKQPKVRNPNGGTSTVYSSSYNVDGREVLLPAVTPDGRFLATGKQVLDEYRRTGRHLGKFDTPENATAYAEQLHNDYAAGKYEPMPQTLAQLVRAKYPSVYDQLNDQQLESAVRAKFPGVYDQVPSTPAPAAAGPAASSESDMALAAAMGGGFSPAQATAMGETAGNVTIGAAKGAGQTAVNAGRIVTAVPGITRGLDAAWGQPGLTKAAFTEADRVLAPTNTEQTIGKDGEQVAEYFIPGSQAERWSGTLSRMLPRVVPRILPKMAVESAVNAGVTTVHRGDVASAALTGAAVPVLGEGVTAGVNLLGKKIAPSMVRSAVKPTVDAMKRQAGASGTGIDAQANKLVDFILEHRLTSADKAQAVIDGAEREIQGALQSARGAVTDAPQRAQRYLQALERSASQQGLPAEDVAIIRTKAQELLQDSPLSTDVVTTVMKPSPTGLVGASGQPVMVPTPVTTRALRTDVRPDEALGLARGSAKWGNNKSWGEQKGAAREASKTVERANRDAVKTAVPATREPLQRQAGAIVARGALDRQAMREGNRDALGLVPMLALASGHDPLAIGTTLLRSQGGRLGIYARVLADALARKDVRATTAILTRLGVSADEQSTVPMPTTALAPAR